MTTSSGQSSSNSTSDAVIQQTNPAIAMQAGLIGSEAAGEASNLDSAAISNGIQALNTQYNAAVSGLQPAEQSGVQALDQLNQYLGLSPYQPTAPTAPTAPPTTPTGLDSLYSQATGLLPQLSAINKASGDNTPQTVADWNNPNLTATQNQENLIASVATQLGSGGVPTNGTVLGSGGTEATKTSQDPNAMNPADLNFLSAYTGAGGTIGGSGVNLNTALTAGPEATYQSELPQYQQQLANYNQDQAWAQQYATPLTQSQITQNITNQPGFQANLNQGLSAVQSSDAAKGYVGSGAILKDLMSYGQNQLSTYYGQTLSNLAAEAGAGNSAAATQAGAATQLGANTASADENLGETQANAALASGNSLMNALVSANQQFGTMQTGQSSSTSSSSGFNGSGLGSALGALTQTPATAAV